MSENNKNDETEKKEINFDDEKEPIESIEKTVEDLKRKIQELSDEDQKEVDSWIEESKKSEEEANSKDIIDNNPTDTYNRLTGFKYI